MQGQRYPDSTQAAEYFLTKAVELQGLNKRKAQEQPEGSNHDVVGGLVRSYGFNYEEGKDIAQGFMRVDFGLRRQRIPVTVVILGGTVEEGKKGARIVEETAKISDFSFWMLDAHFSTFCEGIGRHIVVYERFLHRFDFNSFEYFFTDHWEWQLTYTWTLRIRQLMELLDYARQSSVTHGGLNDRRSYVVLANGSIKLIDVARNTIGYTKEKDMADLRTFLKEDPFFRTEESVEWYTFDLLLGSNLVTRLLPGWKDAVLGHPLLQELPGEVITAWRGVHKSKEELNLNEATQLANLLCKHWWPDLYKSKKELTKVPHIMYEKAEERKRRQRQATFRTAFLYPPGADQLLDGLFGYSTPEQPSAYGGEIFHLGLIDLTKNMILHGHTYLEDLKNEIRMVEEIRTRFGSLLSMTYYFLRTLDQHDILTGPYIPPPPPPLPPPPPPPRPTIGDVFGALLKGNSQHRGRNN